MADRDVVAGRAAQQLIERHLGILGDDVEHSALDHRLGVGIAAHMDIEFGKQRFKVAWIRTYQHRANDVADQVTNDLRILAEIAAVFAAPTQDRGRFTESGDAIIGGEFQNHIAADRILQRPPRVARAPRQIDDDGFDLGDLHLSDPV